jgi:uncharacterized protein
MQRTGRAWLAPVLACAAMLAGCAPAAPPIVEGDARPAVWEAKLGETRLILFGSVHQLPPELDWFNGVIAREVESADRLFLEIAPAEAASAPALFEAIADDEPVSPLDRRIGLTAADRAGNLLAGIDEAEIDRTESWALALMIGNAIAADNGLSGEAGVESRLTAAFEQAGKPVAGLESARDQLTLFDALDPAVQDAMLARAISRSEGARERTRELIRAWARGDVAAITAAAANELSEFPTLESPLIGGRNRAWADRLTAHAQASGGTALVAVGAGHLAGESSLERLLAARGFTVRRIQ